MYLIVLNKGYNYFARSIFVYKLRVKFIYVAHLLQGLRGRGPQLLYGDEQVEVEGVYEAKDLLGRQFGELTEGLYAGFEADLEEVLLEVELELSFDLIDAVLVLGL